MGDGYDEAAGRLYGALAAEVGRGGSAAQVPLIAAALRAAADAARAGQRRRDAEVCRALSRETWAWHVEDGEPEDSAAALKSNTYENAALAIERGAGRPEGA